MNLDSSSREGNEEGKLGEVEGGSQMGFVVFDKSEAKKRLGLYTEVCNLTLSCHGLMIH
jgi:hypothetical protein